LINVVFRNGFSQETFGTFCDLLVWPEVLIKYNDAERKLPHAPKSVRPYINLILAAFPLLTPISNALLNTGPHHLSDLRGLVLTLTHSNMTALAFRLASFRILTQCLLVAKKPT
jgi:hypothetical protein